MKPQILAIALITSSAVGGQARTDDNRGAGAAEQTGTRISVHALASTPERAAFVGEPAAPPPKTGIRHLANTAGRPDSSPDKSDFRREQRETKDRKANGRAGAMQARREQPRYSGRTNVGADENDDQRGELNRARGPWAGNPWNANLFDGNPFNDFTGFNGNGFYSGRVTGYRPFRYPIVFGNPYSFNYPYVPGYYGFGITPVAFGISGPVTTYYDDPVGRQWKLVRDGVENFAAPRRGTNP